MTFDDILTQVLELLQREKRASYRALKRRFDLDDDYLADLKDELIYAKKLASDEEERVLVWTGDMASASSPPPSVVAPASATDHKPTPISYTPRHLTDKILTSRSALEGERKVVTVLFAAIKDSTELIRDFDPEDAQKLLDSAIHIMMDTVHRFEGTVNQVLGDGIMALFGAPIAHEDHAARACYAALAMQAAMQPYAEQVRGAQGIEIHIRVGLNSGEVMVRTIGNDLHMDYSAVGPTTHLAARMEQLARPGSTRLAASTLRLVEGRVQVNALGPIPVKGMTEPVEVYELTGASAIRRRLQAAVARGLTKFVGRDGEIASLHQALEQAAKGHGQIVAAVGEAGVGKSRLVYEFVHSHRTQGWLVLESASVSYGKATPYFPVVDLLKRYVHGEDGDDSRTIRAKVIGHILTLDASLQETIPALLSLLDALPEDSPFSQLDPPQRRQRTLDGLKRILLRESQVQPLLVIVEDLHWIDSETQALLDSLVESLPTARLLLLVNYRPAYQHGWGNKTFYTQLRLDPLPPASADVLLHALLGDDPELAALKTLLIERTEGNPFFLEESVRTLVDTQMLERIYTFKHALTHEVAYGSLLHERRRMLHAQIVEALEALADDRWADHVERLAYHAFRGTVWDKALTYFRQAGTRARSHSANREAVNCFEQAIDALHHLPESRDAKEQGIDLRFELRHPLLLLGELRRVLDYLHEAERLAEVLDDQRRLAWVACYMTSYFFRTGDSERAITSGQRALALGTGVDDRVLQVATHFMLGATYWALNDYEQAIEFHRKVITSLDGDECYERFGLNTLPSVVSRGHLAWCLAAQGIFTEAIAHGEEGLRIAERADHPDSLIRICYEFGHVYLCQGDFSKAIPLYQQGLSLCGNVSLVFLSIAAQLGYAYALCGRITEAMPLLAQAVEQGDSMHVMSWQALWVAYLSQVYLLTGCIDDALLYAEHALDLAETHQERGSQAQTLQFLGDIVMSYTPPDTDQAKTHYQQALSLANELGMRPLQAHCHRDLSTLYRQTEQPEHARAELSTAIDLYREMDMTFWLPETEAALAQVEGR